MQRGGPRGDDGQAILRVLAAVGEYKREGNGYVALCPAHDDQHPSLRIAQGRKSQVMLKCRAGCATANVLQGLRLEWKHLFPENNDRPVQRRQQRRNRQLPESAVPDVAWKRRADTCVKQLTNDRLQELAYGLGVDEPALKLLRVGWITSAQLKEVGNYRLEGAWTFPECDGHGRVCGISLRWDSGDKGFIKGGNRGLTIPTGFANMPGRVHCVEGASDVAALLTLGIVSIGRPSNTGGAEAMVRYLKGRETVIVGENDGRGKAYPFPTNDPKENKRLETLYRTRVDDLNLGEMCELGDLDWPGRDGVAGVAIKLAEYWKRPVYWMLPPEDSKDVRLWLIAHGPDANLVEQVRYHVAGNLAAKRRMEALRKQKDVL